MEWKKKMKKFEWNDLVFFASLAVYLGYYLLFWNVFDNDVLYWKYDPFCWSVLFATPAVNAVCQVIALFQKKWIGILWVLFSTFAWFLAVGFTAGMGV